MTGFRRNIVFSLLLHVTIITAAFSFLSRGTSFRAPAQYLMVFLLREMTGIEEPVSPVNTALQRKIKNPDRDAKTESVPDKNKKIIPVNQNDIDKNTSRNTAEITQPVAPINLLSGISKETTLQNTGGQTERTTSSGTVGKEGFSTLSIHTIASQGGEDVYAIIRNALEKAKTYPALARKRKIEGTVVTGFIINNRGYPQDVKITKTSGHEILDSAAVRIVKNAAPFPFVKGEITVPISFRLTDH